MTTAVRASAFTEPYRPSNLQIRYLTLGGAYLDVTGSGEHAENNRWRCHGCQDHSDFPHAGCLFEMRKKASAHASVCRAIPLT